MDWTAGLTFDLKFSLNVDNTAASAWCLLLRVLLTFKAVKWRMAALNKYSLCIVLIAHKWPLLTSGVFLLDQNCKSQKWQE